MIGFCIVDVFASYVEFLPIFYPSLLTFGGGAEGTYAWIKYNKNNNNEPTDAAAAAAAAATVPPPSTLNITDKYASRLNSAPNLNSLALFIWK